MLTIRRILFPTDFSERATRAFPQAASLARTYDAELHIVNVPETNHTPLKSLPVAPNVLDEWLENQSSVDAEDLKALTVVQRQMEGGRPAASLIEYVDAHDIDLVVMGTHGRRGVRRVLLGSVTEEVLRTAPCPILTVREPRENPSPRRILAPVDFSGAAETAVQHATEIARTYDADLHLVHVVEEVTYPSAYGVDPPLIPKEGVVTQVEKSLGKMARENVGYDRVEVSALVGYAALTILDYVETHEVDLIVIATHGRTGLDRLLLGSVAERVLRRSPVPVFVVKPNDKSLLPSKRQETTSHNE